MYTDGMTTVDKYKYMSSILNEKQWRQYLATEAEERGNMRLVAREAKVSTNTIIQGKKEIYAGHIYTPGSRMRIAGAGPKKIIEKDNTLIKDLEKLVEPKGDPMSLVQWTTKSLTHLVRALKEKKTYDQTDSASRGSTRS